MDIAIFIFYFLLFSFLISRITFFKNSRIGGYNLIFLFLVKILAGIAYGKFYTLPKYSAGADTWRFYRLSLNETSWLLHHPIAFLKDLFIDNYSQSGNIFSGENSYWNDLKSNVIIKLMAVMNVFTHNSYYSNTIFFNFLFLFGLVALFRVLYEIFPQKKLIIIAGIFLLPSTLFWCSGIHKDGLILSATGIIIYTFNKAVRNNFSAKRIAILILCFLAIFSLRNFVLFALIPALISWWLSTKTHRNNFAIFGAVYTSGLIFLLIVSLIFPSVNFLAFTANKQHEFLLLQGGSKISLPELQPTISSFISFIPNAIDMAFFRPHLSEIKNVAYLPAFAENLLILLLLLSSVIFLNKNVLSKPVILALLFFSISILLLSGYTIPFTGAIVRYKSFVLPLLVTPLLCITDLSLGNRNVDNQKDSKIFDKGFIRNAKRIE